jgi:hypothetical protein
MELSPSLVVASCAATQDVPNILLPCLLDPSTDPNTEPDKWSGLSPSDLFYNKEIIYHLYTSDC